MEPGAIATPIWSRGATAGEQLLGRLSAEAIRRYGAQLQADVA